MGKWRCRDIQRSSGIGKEKAPSERKRTRVRAEDSSRTPGPGSFCLKSLYLYFYHEVLFHTPYYYSSKSNFMTWYLGSEVLGFGLSGLGLGARRVFTPLLGNSDWYLECRRSMSGLTYGFSKTSRLGLCPLNSNCWGLTTEREDVTLKSSRQTACFCVCYHAIVMLLAAFKPW